MAIKQALQIGDPLLLEKTKDIKEFNSDYLKNLVSDLADTMHSMHLTGLAAPQIGESVSVFITEIYPNKNRPEQITDELRVYINPRIIDASDEKVVIYEGCGSVVSANLFGPVERPKVITIEAEDLEGKTFKLKADGLLGRVIQHEYDHLQGILFTEIVNDYSKLLDFENYKKYIRNSEEQIENMQITVKELI